MPGQHRHRTRFAREYNSYKSAQHRCRNPRDKAWKYYGGRGIEFRFTSFVQFIAELGPRPEGTTLDRKDNDGHYEPGNVKWSTRSEQRLNSRYLGRSKCSYIKHRDITPCEHEPKRCRGCCSRCYNQQVYQSLK